MTTPNPKSKIRVRSGGAEAYVDAFNPMKAQFLEFLEAAKPKELGRLVQFGRGGGAYYASTESLLKKLGKWESTIQG